MAGPLLVQGLSGLGDNLHQRALLKSLIAKGWQIWLETPWPIVYSDMPQIRCLARRETLRTQAKNAAREAEKFSRQAPPRNARRITITYAPAEVRTRGSVLAAMAASAGVKPEGLDFRMEVPKAWRDVAASLTRSAAGRPILVYRPLMDRREWTGCRARNPDHDAYVALIAAIRSDYCVVSLADLEEDKEWLVGPRVVGDIEFHAGELTFDLMAGLFANAALVMTTPGFAAILAQAVGTPHVCVFGGYETNTSFALGAALTPSLALGPGCGCFRHDHACKKDFDVKEAIGQLREFSPCSSKPSPRPTPRKSTGRTSPAVT